MSGQKGQKWETKPGQKIRISARISDKLEKKLNHFKKSSGYNTSRAVERILEVFFG
jgi:hypothetical protein